MKNYLFFLLTLLLISCSDNPHGFEDYSGKDEFKTYFKVGDSAHWAKKNLDISTWSETKEFPEGDGIFWIRKKINVIKSPKPLQTLGLGVHTFGDYEVFWDGILIGRNGNPGNERNSKKSGTPDEVFVIPSDLMTKGEHTIAFRMSKLYEKHDQRGTYLYIEDYQKLLTSKLKDTIYIHILAGAFLLTFIYYLFLFLGNRKQYLNLLLSLVSLLFFLLIIAEYIKFYIPIHYSDFLFRLQIIGVLTLLISFLVPFYFSLQYQFKYRKQLTFLYGIILLYIYFFYSHSHDITAVTLARSMWVSSILIIGFAVYKKQENVILILLSLLVSYVIYKISIYDKSLFVSFAIITICMFYLHSVKQKQQRLAYEQSIAQSTRLKYELLKKKIQPHFLMNTLTSLIDWVEEAPKKGVQFIEALADEFDLLNQVEDEKLIHISQEIELCKSHLKIMEYRKEIKYSWEDIGVNSEDKMQLIPPAVVHTLLENGITHCTPLDDNSIKFRLEVSSDENNLTYTFLTVANIRKQDKPQKDGTGFKYVKARLTESYKDQWSFSSEKASYGWKNVITINKKV